MKLQTMEDIEHRAKIFYLHITDTEYVKANPTKRENELRNIATATGKISDSLMFLSELAKNIEDKKESK